MRCRRSRGQAMVPQEPPTRPRLMPSPSPSVRRARPGPSPITMDGLRQVGQAPVATDFRQARPNVGQPATAAGRVRILLDDDASASAPRMLERQARAESGASWCAGIKDQRQRSVPSHLRPSDPHRPHDFRRGLRGPNRTWPGHRVRRSSWDPVWEAKTQVSSLGWTAEFRIPFSQLRFGRSRCSREDSCRTHCNEISMWWFLGTRRKTGGPSRFGHIDGIAPGRGARSAWRSCPTWWAAISAFRTATSIPSIARATPIPDSAPT